MSQTNHDPEMKEFDLEIVDIEDEPLETVIAELAKVGQKYAGTYTDLKVDVVRLEDHHYDYYLQVTGKRPETPEEVEARIHQERIRRVWQVRDYFAAKRYFEETEAGKAELADLMSDEKLKNHLR